MNAKFFRLEQTVMILLTYLLIWGILTGQATSLSSTVDPLSELDLLLENAHVNATGIKKIEKIQIKFLQNWFRILINTSLFPIFEQVVGALFFFHILRHSDHIFSSTVKWNSMYSTNASQNKGIFSWLIWQSPIFKTSYDLLNFYIIQGRYYQATVSHIFYFFNQFWNTLRII